MIEQPKVLLISKSRQEQYELWDKYDRSEYFEYMSCPLCGWYNWHALLYCEHCRGQLDRIAVLKTYYEEWKIGKMNSGF